MPQLSEEFVRNRVLEWLSKQGYGVISRVKTISEHGEDIKVRRTDTPTLRQRSAEHRHILIARDRLLVDRGGLDSNLIPLTSVDHLRVVAD